MTSVRAYPNSHIKMKPSVLIVGAGAVAHVAAHKAAQNNDVLGDICIATRKKEKADKIIESIKRKHNIKDRKSKLYAREVDAMNIPAMVKLIKDTRSEEQTSELQSH